MKNRYFYSTALAVFVLSAVFFVWFYEKNANNKEALSNFNKPVTVLIGDTVITADIAYTNDEKVKGLSNKTTLPLSSGLFFVFDTPRKYGIWMKEMLFPIDIFWIDGNYRIVDIKENADPASYPQVFMPKEKALYVLEVNAGFAKAHSVKVGERIVIK